MDRTEKFDPEDRAAALSAVWELDTILRALEASARHDDAIPRGTRRRLARMARDRARDIKSALHQP